MEVVMKKTIVFLVAACLFLTGCATTYKVDHDIIKQFHEPEVSADKTGLFVIRGSSFKGSGRGLWVALNDSVVADLPNSSHVYLELDAGVNTLNFVQAKAGFGYLAIDNQPGATLYAMVNYNSADPAKLAEFIEKDLGQTVVMKTKAVEPLQNKKNNDAYDNQLLNPGYLAYPIMIESSEEITADENHAVVRFYRPGKLIANCAFDVWNQNCYLGSTRGGSYFSVKLKPGHHVFIALSERYSIVEAELAAGKEYAIQLGVGMGWNQAHIKLLPIDLRSNQDLVKKWKESLKSTVVNQDTVESDPIAKRIEMGLSYMENTRKAVVNGDTPTRSLPSDFGM